MQVRVVTVRDQATRRSGRFIYVGRRCAGLAGHPLGNPFKTGSDALERYREWLKDKRAELDELADQVAETKLPLACWCCTWDGKSKPEPACHAVILAKRVATILKERK